MAKTRMHVDYSLWKAKVDRMILKLMPYAKVTAKQVAEIALDMIQKRTPDTTTGTDIRSMWEIKESRQKTRQVFIIENTYQPNQIILFFEEGTRPHVIKSTGSWPLRFQWMGKEVHAHKVRHPGTKAYKMIEQTERYIKPKMDWWERQQYAMLDKIMRQKKP